MNILLTQRRFGNTGSANNPISILDLAPYIRKLGHEVDCFYIDKLPAGEYDTVGLSILNYDNRMMKDALYLKERFRGSRIVVGGKGVCSLSEEDKNLLKDKGIEVWDRSGEEYFSGNKEIDFKNYPPWDARDIKTLSVDREAIMSTRGCPYNCNFCHNTEKHISFFTAKRTVDNIELLFNTGRQKIFFVDDIFTLNKQHMMDIYEECKKRGISIEGKNEFFTHINHIMEESIKTISLFKPLIVYIGIESGDDTMLKALGKPFTAEIAYKKIELLSSYVRIGGLFLIGFPGETIVSLNNTANFVKSVKNFLSHIYVSFYQPVPNTVGFYLAQKKGAIVNMTHDAAKVNYVDNNLTVKDLIMYKYLIIAAYQNTGRFHLPLPLTLFLTRLKYEHSCLFGFLRI